MRTRASPPLPGTFLNVVVGYSAARGIGDLLCRLTPALLMRYIQRREADGGQLNATTPANAKIVGTRWYTLLLILDNVELLYDWTESLYTEAVGAMAPRRQRAAAGRRLLALRARAGRGHLDPDDDVGGQNRYVLSQNLKNKRIGSWEIAFVFVNRNRPAICARVRRASRVHEESDSRNDAKHARKVAGELQRRTAKPPTPAGSVGKGAWKS
ncbi:hypothetical protein EVAR_33938_1 [Eumeta japonica]|uniref:Uncharacterized protein n=1 Tax=Eumeta variegata TaxID=151549 RepID=A0A4C1VXS4_EUMVA|nr:hypothetical protein EVAR_33938_1 [Eumeta japonica]